MHRGNLSRRGFLERSFGALTVGAGLPAWYARRVLADDQEKRGPVAAGGSAPTTRSPWPPSACGGQGTYIMKAAMGQKGVRFVAVCDVDAGAAREGRRGGQGRSRGTATSTPTATSASCSRRGDLDAVTVGTVDHWHALTSIAAMKAGCDVYCEKPLSLTIAEGQAMVKAARKYDRIFQTGSQQRSDARYRLACELVRNGRFGKVHTVEARIGDNPIGGPFDETDVPEGLDWDFWKGPTPDVAYVKEKCHYEFRWWYEYSGGKMTDWGAHHNDIAQWGLGTDDTGPVEVTAVGQEPSKKPNSYNCHPHFAVTYKYADGTRLVTTSDGENGNRFIGDDGLDLRQPGPDRGQRQEADRRAAAAGRRAALRVERTTWATSSTACGPASGRSATSSVGHHSAVVCHIGAIALRMGKPLRWDPDAERFHGPDADEANAMLSREMRSPWKLEV